MGETGRTLKRTNNTLRKWKNIQNKQTDMVVGDQVALPDMTVRYLTVMSHMTVRYLTVMSGMFVGEQVAHPNMTGR